MVGPMGLAAKSEWITFLAGTGAIVLTFLAGAELDPIIFRTKWKEATAVGLVYAVMLELGLNKTEFGKAILAACFVNDLGTVIALGLIFSPFTIRTVIFVVVSAAVFVVLPIVTPKFFRRYGARVYE